jgi:hypothetical protein
MDKQSRTVPNPGMIECSSEKKITRHVFDHLDNCPDSDDPKGGYYKEIFRCTVCGSERVWGSINKISAVRDGLIAKKEGA